MSFVRKNPALVTGLLIAAALTVYMNIPWLKVALATPGYSPVNMGTVDEDRAYYLSRIKQAASGRWLIGNSALYEHRSDISPNGFIEDLTAAIMRISGLSLGSATTLTGFLFPFLILALTFFWMNRILKSPLLTAVSLLTVWISVFGTTGLLRESSPKANLVFFSVYLAVLFGLSPGRLQKILRGCLIGIMMYSYHYHWTLLMAFEGLLVLRLLLLEHKTFHEVVLESLWVWVPLVLIAIPYGARLVSLQGNPVAAEMWRHFGMIETRLPAAPVLQIATVCWIAALFTLRLIGQQRDRESLLLLLLLIAGLIAVNSNIITGREAEFEGHYGRIIRMFTWTTLFLSLGTLLPKRWIRPVAAIVIVVIGLNAAVMLSASIKASAEDQKKWLASGKQPVFDWIKSNTKKDSVILAPYTLSSLIPVYTDDFVFMNYAARSFLVSDQELLERYLVQTAFFPEDSESIDTGVQSVFGNFPGSTYSKTKRIWQILTLFRKPFDKTIADFIPDQTKRRILENSLRSPDINELKTVMQKYRLDYLITNDPLPRLLSRNFQKTATIGAYTVYQPMFH